MIHAGKADSTTLQPLGASSKLKPFKGGPSTPFNDSLREELPPCQKKVLHNVPVGKDCCQLPPSMSLTFHQKKETPASGLEVDSTLAQCVPSDGEGCLTPCSPECFSDVASDLGTDGSGESPFFAQEDAAAERHSLLAEICASYKNEAAAGTPDRSELEHYMNANLASLLSLESEGDLSGEDDQHHGLQQVGTHLLSFASGAVDHQNATLPYATGDSFEFEEGAAEHVSAHEIQIEEQGEFMLTPCSESQETDGLHLLASDSEDEAFLESPAWEDLKKPLIDLLLKFYNGEDQGSDFVQSLSSVMRVLCRWRFYGPINTQSLLNFFIDQVLAVLTEIKQKLVYKAIERFNLLSSHMRCDTDGAPDAPKAPQPEAAPGAPPSQPTPSKYIKEYPECPLAFDQMIVSITQYFELVNLTSYKLEDLWLNLLDSLCLERPNKYTVFKAVHHQGFRNVVLKDPLMQQIIREVDSYKDSGLVHMNPAKHLETIYDIRRNCHSVEESYSELFEQGLQSESLRQLIEYLHDEICAELRVKLHLKGFHASKPNQSSSVQEEGSDAELYGMMYSQAAEQDELD